MKRTIIAEAICESGKQIDTAAADCGERHSERFGAGLVLGNHAAAGLRNFPRAGCCSRMIA
jgi:hypothetical protein